MEKNPLLVLLGRRIRALRKSKGYTQESFAADAGLGRSYYGAIERGERNVAALNLMKAARLLNVEPGELLPSKDEIETTCAAIAAKRISLKPFEPYTHIKLAQLRYTHSQ